jgi:sulfopyruvate decarboxylase TPP-binding subunit
MHAFNKSADEFFAATTGQVSAAITVDSLVSRVIDVLCGQKIRYPNSLGCFATLCQNYRTPFVILVANRGNLFDKNSYDIPKIRYMDSILSAMNLLTTSYYQFRNEPDLITRMMERAETAQEPTLLMLDCPPNTQTVQ